MLCASERAGGRLGSEAYEVPFVNIAIVLVALLRFNSGGVDVGGVRWGACDGGRQQL